jgi:hypothetical protein
VQYINDRSEQHTADDDVRALEDAASSLAEAAPQEKEILSRVARQLGLPEWPEEIGIE